MYNDHDNNILNLLIKHNVNLNIMDKHSRTVLDLVLQYDTSFSEEMKKCVITLIDYGAKTNKPKQIKKIRDFIEWYECLTIKPTIKK